KAASVFSFGLMFEPKAITALFIVIGSCNDQVITESKGMWLFYGNPCFLNTLDAADHIKKRIGKRFDKVEIRFFYIFYHLFGDGFIVYGMIYLIIGNSGCRVVFKFDGDDDILLLFAFPVVNAQYSANAHVFYFYFGEFTHALTFDLL